MLRSGISGHLQAPASVLKRRIKIVCPEKKTPEVGAADFDLLRNVYIFKQCDGFQQKNGKSFLHLS